MSRRDRSKEDIILVAGASSGIGRATALMLNREGASVIACARRQEKLEELKDLAQRPDALFIETKDLASDIFGLPQWVHGLSNKYGRLSGLVFSAGIQKIVPLKALTLQQLRDMFEINFFAAMMLSKGFCDKRVNTGKGSSIVLVSSVAAVRGEAGIAAYSASKGALDSAARSIACEAGRDGIRVNSVLPGFLKTEMTEKWKDVYTDGYIAQIEKDTPLGPGSAEDAADLIAFLLSGASSWITGQNIVIDGGASL